MKIRCLFPFVYLQLDHSGRIFICCPAWTKAGPVGNIFKNDILQIWNSPKAQFIRRQIYKNRLETICHRQYCPFYLANKNQPLEEWLKEFPFFAGVKEEILKRKTKLSSPPLYVELADSGECNLRCKMCVSNSRFIPSDPKLTKLIFQKVLPRILPGAARIALCGNGEVFFRPETIKFLADFPSRCYPHLCFNLLTNGLLFDEKMWEKIKHNQFDSISVSLDAASKTTYEKIRHGDWNRLQKNLKLISRLRKQGKFLWFQINFVVMRSNYREMAEFVRLGIKLGCDRVQFTRIFGETIGCLEENFNLVNDQKIINEIRQFLKEPVFSHPSVDIIQMRPYINFQPNWGDRLGWRQLYYPLKLKVKEIKENFYKLLLGHG